MRPDYLITLVQGNVIQCGVRMDGRQVVVVVVVVMVVVVSRCVLFPSEFQG